MELLEGEYPTASQFGYDPKMSDQEKNEITAKMVEVITHKCIAKAMTAQNESFTFNDWMSFPQRLRLDIAKEIFEKKKVKQENFCNGQHPTVIYRTARPNTR